jgi:acyl-CoA synthetase (AMP-forming)/AMP-acid ligase II/NAD(P)-dependent dehydrogenase (short-subunit alcohol dehydrogenase family)
VEELAAGVEDERWHAAAPDDAVLNLLTSGSTGVPKCVQHHHRSIVARTSAAVRANGFTRHEIGLNVFPLDHVGGLVMSNVRDTFLCAEHVNARVESFLARPIAWLDWVDRYRATTTWAPNFAFALVNQQEDAIRAGRWDLSSMRHICNAGEAVVHRTAHRFLELLEPHGLPADAMVPAWGMSETTSAVTFSRFSRGDTKGVHTIDSHSIADRLRFVERGAADAVDLTDLGGPIPGVRLRIVDQNNQLLVEDHVGRVQISGAALMAGYYRNPAANEQSWTADGWFNTGDLGFLHQGRLTLTGREKDLIIINGANVLNHDIEAIVERVDGVEVTYAAACALSDPSYDTDRLAVFFVPSSLEATDRLRTVQRIRSALSRQLQLQPDLVVPVEREQFPRTASGKIQRDELVKALRGGHLDQSLRALEVEDETDSTLPSWFFERVWHPAAPERGSDLLPRGSYLLFEAPGALAGSTLHGRLVQAGGSPIVVRPGNQFARLDGEHYEIDPGEPAHYERLLDAILEDGVRPDIVVHAWGLTERPAPATQSDLGSALDQEVLSVVWLIKHLANRGLADDVEMIVATRGGYWVSEGDRVSYPRGALTGLLMTAAAEQALRCVRQIDIAGGDATDAVVQELSAVPGDVVVAYRDGRRLIPKLRRTPLPANSPSSPNLTPRGVYLVTGGLGGIGFELAQYLLAAYQARLLIVGRTALDADVDTAARFEELRELGEVVYAQADVADVQSVRAAVEQAESRWGDLNGVLHLAGESVADQWDDLERHLLRTASAETFARMFRAKVLGTWALAQALHSRPETLLVLFSSVNGYFGGRSFGPYAAANSFVDGFADYWGRQEHRPVNCLAWSMWSDIGMNRHSPIAVAAQHRGFRSIGVSQGLASFLTGLGLRRVHLLVGLDSRNPYIREHLASSDLDEAEVVVAYTGDAGAAAMNGLRQAVDSVSSQAQVRVSLTHLAAMPRDTEGCVDRRRLLREIAVAGRAQVDEYDEPIGEAERGVAACWQEVLGVARVGRHDSFFVLGGNSLQAAQIIARINERFGVDRPLRTLYEHPTPSRLAGVLAGQVSVGLPA